MVDNNHENSTPDTEISTVVDEADQENERKKEIKELKKDNKKYIIRWSKDTESLLNKLKQKDKKIKELEQTLTKLRNKYLDIKGELENAIPRGISPYYDIVQKILKRLKK